MKYIFAIILFIFGSLANASQDLYAPISELQEKVTYEIEPLLLNNNLCNINEGCKAPIYKGNIAISIKLMPKNNILNNVLVEVNGRLIKLDTSNIKGKEVNLRNLKILYNPRYLPKQLRGEYAGSGPYFTIKGILFSDSECENSLKELNIHYNIEESKSELTYFCATE
ncbi:hypothetical protein GCM10011613_37300 [Cellvibrio zantedeschiae]|uniref:Uncharacterized protein n=1 Tax=Cellvibrio zantedeschiae TaxID=1237077 RepID=A0ABQ3BB55_9GAMM|nr:hypothetical protein [Cellvibrio zantedeschiae]GGY89029.1 hypothetical protein GCM10011613_37300 [Cellvibrio zantedeschiae]